MIEQGIDFKKQLQSMSLKDLEDMISNAELVAKAKRIDTRQAKIKEITDLAAQINMRVVLSDINVKPSKLGLKIAIKYRDPENIANAWTGRGVKPVWLRDKLEAGHDLSEFLIN